MAEEEKQKKEEAQTKTEVVPKKEEFPAAKPSPAETNEAKNSPKAAQERVKPTNCAQCNKPLKRGDRYYRNGKFYCNKKCWKKSTEKVA